MKKFEYEITRHPADEFSQLVYFCTDQGECRLEEVPLSQTDILKNILNEKGLLGWELVQVIFGKEGVVAFWKRKM